MISFIKALFPNKDVKEVKQKIDDLGQQIELITTPDMLPISTAWSIVKSEAIGNVEKNGKTITENIQSNSTTSINIALNLIYLISRDHVTGGEYSARGKRLNYKGSAFFEICIFALKKYRILGLITQHELEETIKEIEEEIKVWN